MDVGAAVLYCNVCYFAPSPLCDPLNLLSLWCLPQGHCQASSSVGTRSCWTGVYSWCLSDFPYCGNVPGRLGAWMTFSPQFPQQRPRGHVLSQRGGSHVAGSPGLEPRGRASASSPSGRPWCSAGSHPPVSQGAFFSYTDTQTFTWPVTFEMRCVMGEKPSWFCGAEAPSPCDECPSILDFVCWGQSRCPAIWKQRLHVQQLSDSITDITDRRRSLLFTVNSWMFPAGLTNEDPVLHFICGQRAPWHRKSYYEFQDCETSWIHVMNDDDDVWAGSQHHTGVCSDLEPFTCRWFFSLLFKNLNLASLLP